MDGVTLLHWASNEQVARILLDHGADPNAKDNFSRTPFREARVKRRPEVARLLFEFREGRRGLQCRCHG